MAKKLRTAQFIMSDNTTQHIWFYQMEYNKEENMFALDADVAKYFVPRENVRLFRIFPREMYS